MNIRKAIGQLSVDKLSDVEYVRLASLGFSEEQLKKCTKQTYEKVIAEYNRQNAEFLNKSKTKVNIWKAPIQPSQVEFLESFGYTFSDEDLKTITDGQARSFIHIVNFAIGHEKFVAAYPSWLKDSTTTGKCKFTQDDVDEVATQISEYMAKKAVEEQKVVDLPKPAGPKAETVSDFDDEDEDEEEDNFAFFRNLKKQVAAS
jgi:hypothetical protein